MRAFDPLAFPGSDADCSLLDMAGRILAGPYFIPQKIGDGSEYNGTLPHQIGHVAEAEAVRICWPFTSSQGHRPSVRPVMHFHQNAFGRRFPSLF